MRKVWAATFIFAGMLCACAIGLRQDYKLAEGGGGAGLGSGAGVGGAADVGGTTIVTGLGGGGGEPCVPEVPEGPTVLVSGAFAGSMSEEQAQTITLIDLDGDGLAEICGHDGERFVCHARRAPCDTSDEVFWSLPPLDAAWLTDDAQRTSLRFGDVDGNGRIDACVRKPSGIWCALGQPGVVEAPLERWSSSFSAANGWDGESHAPTIQLMDMDGDGDADICGRGVEGVFCALSVGTGAAPAEKWSVEIDYSDEYPDNKQPFSYLTFRIIDIGGSKQPDVCIGVPGLHCAINKAPGTLELNLSSKWQGMTDHPSWKEEQYYRTIQFPDLDGDGLRDVCARGEGGLYCALSLGTAFDTHHFMLPELADQMGWNQKIRYRTLRVVDVDGDGRPDACGRDGTGIVCGLRLAQLPDEGPFFANLANWSPAFADDGDFEEDDSQIFTLQTAEVDGTPGVEWCARRLDGIWCTSD
ncbi:MAG: VCBS repeat-containing protein [Myxococcales bacterium]|nr:VCBS repeat-containing protein [Myxococcales bacterium]